MKRLLTALLLAAGCKRPPVDVEVTLTWPNAKPTDVESQLVVPVERALSALPKLARTDSVARPGGAKLRVSFQGGTDPLQAKAAVDGAIHLATVPQDAEVSSQLPLARRLYFRLIGAQFSGRELRELADWVVSQRLRRVPGVNEVEICGGQERRVFIRVDAMRAKAYSLTMPEIARALSMSNVRLLGTGRIRSAGSDHIEGFAQSVILQRNGVPVRVKDVASVEDGGTRAACQARVDGQQTVIGTILLRDSYKDGAVDDMLQRLKSDLPQGVRIEFLAGGPAVRLGVPPETSALAVERLASEVDRQARPTSHGTLWVEMEGSELRYHGVDPAALTRMPVPGVALLDGPNRHTLVLTGDDLGALRQFARSLDGITEGAAEVPTVDVEIDRQMAARMGVAIADLVDTLSYTGEGRQVSTLFSGNRHFPVMLRTDEAILSPDLVRRRTSTMPSEIFRRDGQRVVLVHFFGNLPDIKSVKIPAGIQVTTQTP